MDAPVNNFGLPVLYTPKREPWAHQRTALERLNEREAFALFMAMRTGKTKVTLDDWARLVCGGACDDLLVVAPAGVYRTWLTALDEHLSEGFRPRTSVLCWSAGDKGSKARERLVSFLLVRDRPRVLLVNIEALSNVERARELCAEFLDQRRCMFVIDESTTIKNPMAKRTKFINRELRKLASYRRILSGLPTPRSPLDIYSQFEFLDPSFLGFKSFFGFRARHAVMKRIPVGGRQIDIVVGYRDVEELQQKIAPHSYRVKLEDCYDLPPKIYMTREVPLTPEQERLYGEMKTFATAQLSEFEHVSATIVIAQIMRMHQMLCGHTVDETGVFHEIPERRTETLLDVLEEHEGKAIIWCSYDADVRKVAKAIEKHFNPDRKIIDESALLLVARFWGGNRADREDEEQRFMNDPDCKYMVATAAAGGRGRKWVTADLVVYYSNTADLEHRAQSEERAQAIDKVNSVAYVDLVAPDTVDMKMLKTLRSKIDMAATITNDGWRAWLI